jgi:hypothetical protein
MNVTMKGVLCEKMCEYMDGRNSLNSGTNLRLVSVVIYV